MIEPIKEIEGVPFDEWKLHIWLNFWQRFRLLFKEYKTHRHYNRVCVYKKIDGLIVVYDFFDVPPTHWNCKHKIFTNDN